MFLNPKNTLTASEVPAFVRDPGIIYGYRHIDRKWSYYLKSIFKIHNETFNIWTHAVALIFHISLLYEGTVLYNYYREQQSWPLLLFGLCCIFSTAVSVIAHIFHTKSKKHHYNMLILDYVGASCYGYGSGIIALHYFSDKTTYRCIKKVYLFAHWTFCWLDFTVICIAKISLGHTSKVWTRKIVIIIPFIGHAFLLTATVVRKYWLFCNGDTSHVTSLTNYNWIYLLFFLQALSYGSHLPEVILPGLFDIIGQSHQIFHVFATLTQTLQITAVHFEIKNGNSKYDEPNLLFLLTSVITTDN